jgi:SNF2 family DNA or RNA helicase
MEPPWLEPPALEVVALILESHRAAFGASLVAGIDPRANPRLAAQEVFAADQAVLAHDGSADPRLIYANAAALRLWRRPWAEMIGMPSRLTAEPEEQPARAKVQRLEEILEEVIEAGDRALLFTQFAEWGLLLKAHLERRWRQEVPFLYGSTSKTERQAMVDRFQEDPRGPQLFLLSLKAGGVGLNLTRASHVFHIDRWWNPAVENQATDRAYRIGQTNRVLVHKFITSGSVEERIDRMIREKSKLAEEIVGSGEDWLGGMDVGQLRDLVSLSEE